MSNMVKVYVEPRAMYTIGNCWESPTSEAGNIVLTNVVITITTMDGECFKERCKATPNSEYIVHNRGNEVYRGKDKKEAMCFYNSIRTGQSVRKYNAFCRRVDNQVTAGILTVEEAQRKFNEYDHAKQ